MLAVGEQGPAPAWIPGGRAAVSGVGRVVVHLWAHPLGQSWPLSAHRLLKGACEVADPPCPGRLGAHGGERRDRRPEPGWAQRGRGDTGVTGGGGSAFARGLGEPRGETCLSLGDPAGLCCPDSCDPGSRGLEPGTAQFGEGGPRGPRAVGGIFPGSRCLRLAGQGHSPVQAEAGCHGDSQSEQAVTYIATAETVPCQYLRSPASPDEAVPLDYLK